MKTLLVGVVGLLALVGCQQNRLPVSPVPPVEVVCDRACHSSRFQESVDQLIDELWQLSPTQALYNGVYQYADQLEIPDEAYRLRKLAFSRYWRERLQSHDNALLSIAEQTDKALLLNLLNTITWEINEFVEWQWNPALYNVAGPFARLLTEGYAPLDQRLTDVLQRMVSVPAYYQAARANLTQPTLEHTELALLQNRGALEVISSRLLAQARASGLSAEQKALFEDRYLKSRQAILSYVSYLERLKEQLQQQGARSFRIGEALYEQKFALELQSGLTAEQLYRKARQDRAYAFEQMASLTAKLWPKYFPTEPMPTDRRAGVKKLVAHLSKQHVAKEDFVDTVRAQLPRLVEFVNDKGLLTLDPDKPLVVRETPQYLRGFSVASVSAPGPYDKGGNTYYNVIPLHELEDERAESYLREYNHWMLQILNIHEAIPGHYAQLVYSNKSPSMVKSLFGNVAMVEGWAVYSERMMLEQGYGDFEPELWLMYWKWTLRVVTNTIIDYEIHVLGVPKEEILTQLVNGAFQQREEAEQKWRRATLSQVQLASYYAGFREIYDLREQVKNQQGPDFDLKQFNESLLSFGSAPVKVIRTLMLPSPPDSSNQTDE